MNITTIKNWAVALFSITILTSCGDDDPGIVINEPATYVFERNGESTVSFSGQTTRTLMAEEILSAFKDPTKSQQTIDAMFAHTEGSADFTNADLNVSDKSVRSKTAASSDLFSSNTALSAEIKSDFDSWIAEQVDTVFPNWELEASVGVAGQIQEAGGGSIRYVNGKGLELNQAFNKGLIGALFVDQIVNNYVSTSVLDAGNNVPENNAGVLSEGKSYTNMEHKWDEAYGYAYAKAADETDPNATLGENDSFLYKYIGRVEGDEDFTGIADEIYNAFKLGRAAIVAGDYEVRDVQAEIIREKISTVIAVRAVYYLQQGKAGLEQETVDYASVFHSLSEGLGFVYGLQFTRQPNSESPYFTNAEVNAMMDDLMTRNGFWDVSTTTLDDISNDIAAKFSFTVEEAGS
ncbi:protein of unknown function [Ekhidna lutea]|uniref:DUF4856 domain-containing protein n=2 Tax=Ekhidna lutea TaxID=447679 RepID=A0A239F779_EKHLU|nr:protein of unknown function [Ekhidna lutea]